MAPGLNRVLLEVPASSYPCIFQDHGGNLNRTSCRDIERECVAKGLKLGFVAVEYMGYYGTGFSFCIV